MIKKAIIGLFAGIICGFFGSGGGLILVPAFIYILKMEDRNARATSVFSIMPMVIVSSLFYIGSEYVDYNLAFKCIIGGTVGGIIGAKILQKISIKALRVMFILFLIYASVRMIFA